MGFAYCAHYAQDLPDCPVVVMAGLSPAERAAGYDDATWVGPSVSEGRRVVDTVLGFGALAMIGGPLLALVAVIEVSNCRAARRSRRESRRA